MFLYIVRYIVRNVFHFVNKFLIISQYTAKSIKIEKTEFAVNL